MSNENYKLHYLITKSNLQIYKDKNFTKKFKSQKVNVHRLLNENQNQNQSLYKKKKLKIGFFLIVFVSVGLYSSFL